MNKSDKRLAVLGEGGSRDGGRGRGREGGGGGEGEGEERRETVEMGKRGTTGGPKDS